MGNSAADISVDLSKMASQVYVSTRRGAWVVGRMGPYGLPMDALANSRLAFSLPRSLLQKLVEMVANFKCHHPSYGLQPLHRALEAHPTISDDLPLAIMTGRVEVRSNIRHFTAKGVVFEDGSEEEDIDAVIFATGYRYHYPYISPKHINLSDGNEVGLYKCVYPPHQQHPTLGVIGLVQAIGAIMPISEMQARWYTRVIKGSVTLPSVQDMQQSIEDRRSTVRQQYYASTRHTLETYWIPYMDEIASEIGARPDLLSLAKKDPCLALRCLVGPCVPAQYRLEGPGVWTGASSTIRSALHNCVVPLCKRKVSCHEEGSGGCKIQSEEYGIEISPTVLFKLVIAFLIVNFLLYLL